jgi:hypothetical protein
MRYDKVSVNSLSHSFYISAIDGGGKLATNYPTSIGLLFKVRVGPWWAKLLSLSG